MTSNRRITSWAIEERLALLIMLVPFAGYIGSIALYATDIPFWDDYAAFLDPLCHIVATDVWRNKAINLFTNHGYHPFVVERLVLLLQLYVGKINFYYFLLLANLGWAMTVGMLVWYFHKDGDIPYAFLIPIPYLMLAATHWEAMDFATASFQYYWGGGFFALLAILMTVKGRGGLSGLCCGLALLSFGGAKALIPVCIVGFLMTRQWMQLLYFGLVTGLLIGPSFYFNSVTGDTGDGFLHLVVDPWGAIKYIAMFMGNYTPTGIYHLGHSGYFFFAIGILVLIIAFIAYRRSPPFLRRVPLLLLGYVLLMAIMAAATRFEFVIPARYSMYALMIGAVVYAWILTGPGSEPCSVWQRRFAISAILASMLYWTYMFCITTPYLQANEIMRNNVAKDYLIDGNPETLKPLFINSDFAHRVLLRAKELDVYIMTSVD